MKKVFALFFALIALAPLHAGWKKTVTKGGKTTVTGDAETMARHEKQEQARAAYQKDIAAAPRRGPTDPIAVTLLTPVWDGKNRNENHERANQMLLNEFKNDPVLRVTQVAIPRASGRDSGADSDLAAEASRRGKGGAVFVSTFLGTEAALGRKKDGKLAVGQAIVYKARVFSPYTADSKDAKELGNLLQTTQMVKKLAVEIRARILNDLGPRLPAPAAVAEIDKKNTAGGLREQAGIEPGDDAKTVLKKLLKPKVKPE